MQTPVARAARTLAVLAALSLLAACGGDADSSRLTGTKRSGLSTMISPTPPFTFTGTSQAFSWAAGSDEYALFVGSSLGEKDTWGTYSLGTATSHTVTNLPIDGRAVYVRLWDRIGPSWTFQDYVYTGWSAPPQAMTSPASGSTLGASATFTWTAGADEYALFVGTSVGAKNIWGSYSLGTATSRTVTNLPLDGSTIHVRLFYRFGPGWYQADYSYSAASVSLPVMTSPAPGSTLGSSATFTWSAGADEYALFVGRSIGAKDIWGSYSLGTATSRTITNMPIDGSTVYVRLFYRIGPTWYFGDYTYVAAFISFPTMTSPTPGSTLGYSATFTWSVGADEYALFVGRSVGAKDIWGSYSLGMATSRTIANVPIDGSAVYVRLFYRLGVNWYSIDYTYVAPSISLPVVTSPPPGSALGTSATFTWGAGADEYALFVGRSVGAKDIWGTYSLGTATSRTVTNLPPDHVTVHVRLFYRLGVNWYQADYRYNALDLDLATIDRLTAPSFRGAATPTGTVLAHIVVNPDGTLTDLTGNTSWTAVGGTIPHGNTGLWSRGWSEYSGPFDASHYWVGDAATKTWLDAQTAGNFTICARFRPAEHPGLAGDAKTVFAYGKPEQGGHDGWSLMQMHRSSCFHYHADSDQGEAMRPTAWPAPNDADGVLPTFDYAWMCGGRSADLLGVLTDGDAPNGVFQMEGASGNLGTPSFRRSPGMLPSIGAYADGTGAHDGGVYEVIITSDPASGESMTRIVAAAASGIYQSSAATYVTGADAQQHRIDPSNVIGAGSSVTPQIALHWGVPLVADTQQTGACFGFDATIDGDWAAVTNWFPLVAAAPGSNNWPAQLEFGNASSGNCVKVLNDTYGTQFQCGARSPAPAPGSRHRTLACFDPVDLRMRLYADGSTVPFVTSAALTGGTAAFPRLNELELFTPARADSGIHIHRVWACSGADPARCP